MVVEYEINLEDIKASLKNSLRTSRFHKRNKIIYGFVGALLILVISIPFKFDTFYYILTPILFFILGRVFYNIGLIYQTERIIKINNANKSVDYKLYLSENGFKTEFKGTTQYFTWSEVKKVSEDEKRYFIYLTDLNSVIIKKEPKNLSENEVVNFNKLISEYIKTLS